MWTGNLLLSGIRYQEQGELILVVGFLTCMFFDGFCLHAFSGVKSGYLPSSCVLLAWDRAHYR